MESSKALNNIAETAITPLETALKANIPLLYVASLEENRVIAGIETCCFRLGRKLWFYSITEGLWSVNFFCAEEQAPEIVHGDANPDYRDPVDILRCIKDIHIPRKGAVFGLLDFHEYLTDGMIRRHLRDLGKTLKRDNSAVIILAPSQNLPQSLADEFWCYEFPLPSQAERVLPLKAAWGVKEGSRHRLFNDEALEEIAAAGQGLTLDQMENSAAEIVAGQKRVVGDDLVKGIRRRKQELFSRSSVLEQIGDDGPVEMGGLSVLKQWLFERRHGFSEKARQFGLPAPGGLLLLGVPGCGKSLAARMIARLWEISLLRLDTGSLFTGRVGGSEERIRQALKSAEAIAPCVLWIDEIEKAMAGIGGSAESDAGTAARVFAFLATWMQEKPAPVFVTATANSVSALPAEMLRKGRWDDVFFIDLPGLGEREEIIKIHLEKRRQDPGDFDIRQIAEHCAGFSGAEIEHGIIAALYRAFDEGRELMSADILDTISSQVPLSATMKEDIDALRNWAAERARPASRDDVQQRRTVWKQGKGGKIKVLSSR